MPVVRTVRGAIPSADLGVCYGHEHLLGGPLAPDTDPDLVLRSEAAALLELTWFSGAGGHALVEMSPVDYGRDVAGLRRVSEAAGIHIVCATGHHKQQFSAPWVHSASIDSLAESFVQDLTVGIAGTKICAGVIKAASSLNQITADEEKVLRAAALAHHATGAPISTHTEAGTMGLEQVALTSKRRRAARPDRHRSCGPPVGLGIPPAPCRDRGLSLLRSDQQRKVCPRQSSRRVHLAAGLRRVSGSRSW